MVPGMTKFYHAIGFATGELEVRVTDLKAQWRGKGARSLLLVDGIVYNDGVKRWGARNWFSFSGPKPAT